MKKLLQMNPYITIETVADLLKEDTVPQVFKNVDVLTKFFDDQVMKATVLRTVLTNMAGTGYVGSSGLAGYGDNNAIRTKKKSCKCLYYG